MHKYLHEIKEEKSDVKLSGRKNCKISVVIPAYNEEKFISNAIASLQKQTYAPFEIIVVDNASKDKTAEIAEKLGVKVVKEFRRGVGYARETGFKAAKGDIIASADADAIYPKKWLSKINNSFSKNPNLTLLAGPCILPYSFSTLFLVTPMNLFCLFILREYWGTNMSIRKEAFNRSGGFNTSLALGEDTDLGRKMEKLGDAKIDPFLYVNASSRRFQNGIIIALIYSFIPPIIEKIKTGKNFTYPTVRSKDDLPQFNYMVFLAFIVVLLILLCFISPDVTQAKVAQYWNKFANYYLSGIGCKQ